MSRSHRANHFGSHIERYVFSRFPSLVPQRSTWFDGTYRNGTPVEIKATMQEHRNGKSGTFKLYEQSHRRLAAHEGYYIFVVYQPRPQGGVRILKTKRVSARRLPRLVWHGGGDHRRTRQARLLVGRLFRQQ